MPSVLRTPDDRFRALPDFDFEPHYLDNLPGYEGLRCHYLDLGPQNAERTVLCVHGQPTWAYLFRHMIPIFRASGARVVVPDLFGFGRSGQRTVEESYPFSFHRCPDISERRGNKRDSGAGPGDNAPRHRRRGD